MLNSIEVRMAGAIDRLAWKRRLPLLIVAAVVLVIDQVTKALVRAKMELGESIPAEGKFRFTYSTNEGSVFGLPLNSTFLLVMGIVVVIAVVWVYFRYLSAARLTLRIGLGLLLGGAMGNLIDRIRFGEVTDFIDVRLWGNYHWATFNVADAALSTGIVVLLYSFLLMARSIR